jgi:chemotaxis protein methyltransferase WspC
MVAELARLLKDAIGLDVASVGLPAIERAMRDRQAACGLPNAPAYVEHVRTSRAEMQALIEAVVVPETWFFRDPGAFDALSAIVRHRSVPVASAPLRVLSVPSSTGEEPYSIAMALLDAGLTADRFHVEAIDVSERALANAARGVYGRHSFRGQGALGRDHHFEALPEGRRVSDRVRRQVRFQIGNVLALPFTPGRDAFDVIFCRNLLIYFDRDTQRRALTGLAALLARSGLLFVGSSEGALALGQGMTSAKLPMAFAFRAASERPTRDGRVGAAAPRPSAPAPGPLPSPGHSTSAPAAPPSLAAAQRLADEGRFDEAGRACEAYLASQGPSAAAFYLRGLVSDAAGQADEAAGFYRKALYLDPVHHDAVVQLALLVEQQGRSAEAEVLWGRARRLARETSA